MPQRQEFIKPRSYKSSKLQNLDSASNFSPKQSEDDSDTGVLLQEKEKRDDEAGGHEKKTEEEDEVAASEAVDTIDDLRKRMDAALALQRKQHADPLPLEPHAALDSIALRRTTTERQGSSQESLGAATTGSTESVQTVKGKNFGTPASVRTPSYPFPRMALHLPRGQSQLSGPRHKPFTLLSPTNAVDLGNVQPGFDQPRSSEPNTPRHQQQFQSRSTDNDLPDDPNYPLPDLYDLVLLLNAEPGLDPWWANVTEILSEVYGAERASLAVPGDLTDLENIPWGQRASFNILGVEKSDSSTMESTAASEHAGGHELDVLPNKQGEDGQSARNPKIYQRSDHRRPLLESRHSIAGVTPDSVGKLCRQRPSGPVRAVSGRSEVAALEAHRAVQDSLVHPHGISEKPAAPEETLGNSSESASQGRGAIVHRALHALEAEQDPLIVRTGVTALFGKRRPVVMTRSFADSSVSSGYPKAREKSKADDGSSRQTRVRLAAQSSTGPELRSKFLPSTTELQAGYEEFEQPEPNPWSKSPYPSPAARADPSESPFFNLSAHVDENAFDPEYSAYEYSFTQPVEAIGTDCSKTVIHIPLIQPVPSRRPLSSNLRFPTAIISLLTTITPYPLSLRHSLAALLPHLASSYSMAQQFSTLEAHTRRQSLSRYSRGLGLGGTFSDEGSELELVAELSGQIARGPGDELRRSVHGSVRSPSERSTVSKDSLGGTPLLEPAAVGFMPGLPPTPGRSGAEMVDSYFSSKRQKHVASFQQLPRTPGAVATSTPRRPNGEESPARPKKQIPITSQPLVKMKTSRQPGQSSPSSPRQEAVSELLEGEPLHLEPSSIEAQEHNSLRHQFGAMHGTALSRDLGGRSLPDSVSQLLLNSVPLQLFLAKPRTGELIWTNSKFDAFRSQAQPQGVRTKDPWRNIHDADRQSLVRSWSQVLRTGAQMTQHIRVKRFSNDSDYRWFIFRANPLLTHAGQLIYWIGSFLDVHDQHVAEMKAAEERDSLLRNAKYQALANSIPQILFEAIENVGIVSANEQWQTFSGQSLEEALNLGFTKHVHHDDLKKCGIISAAQGRDGTIERESGSNESSKTATVAQPEPRFPTDALSLTNLVHKGVVTVEQDENGRISYSTEIRLRSRGGEFRWFLVRLVRVESDLLNSGRVSWYGTCTDINDRRALEKELNRVNQRMQQEMESKTKFFANMSHEIRTPLNGILGSIPWLVESSLEPDQRRTLDTIQNSSNNLRELVDNILDVTKLEAGKMTMAFKWFHIRTLLEEIIDTIASRAIDKGLQLNYTVDLNVPSTVKGDPFRLRQILINLMGNAVKFTDVGEVYTRCFVKEISEGQTVEPNTIYIAFEVVDTGRGFSKSECQRLFQQFGQIVGSSSHDAGSGLGLFLSRQLVELHGGRLTADSEVDQGSTFSFDIRVETRPTVSPESLSGVHPAHEMANPSDTARAVSASGRNARTPTVSKRIIQSPGFSKYVASPETQSPALASSGSSNPSVRSFSGHQTDRSSMSSLLPTPEHAKQPLAGSRANSKISERQSFADRAMEASPATKQSKGSDDGKTSPTKSLSAIHPTTYSIVVICPAQYARAAIKQHIEQVVPHQIAVNVTALNTIQEYLELMDGATTPVFTHVVLDLPVSHDLMLFMRQMPSLNTVIIPTLVIITDHYQKREIADEYAGLTRAGRVAYMVHKPVKPSVFALIFDPAQQRNLSKDRNRDIAQSVSEDFKNVADRVKSRLSGKSYRILLVEDSEVNRTVILRYLKKVDLASETAANGQECLDMVMSKQPGYYSLILCDIQMPIKDGYDTCRELRQWEASHNLASMPVMALTANAMPEERAAAARVGFTDYLTKPVEFNKLGTMMVTLLDPKIPHVFLRDRRDREGN